MAVARTKPALALGAVIVGPLQIQRSQYALERFSMAPMILGRASAGAGQFRTRMIGSVSIQPLFERPRGQTQSLSSRRHLHSFEIQIPNGLAA